MTRTLIIGLLFLCISCSKSEKAIEHSDNSSNKTDQVCAIYETRNWHAWLDKLAATPESYRLIISGELDLPTPYHQISWRFGPTDRALPPGQRILLEVKNTKADAMAAQVVTPTKFEITKEVPHNAYRKIIISCGERVIVEIPDVRLTD